MKGFLARVIYSSLILAGSVSQGFAQTTTESNLKGAYFVQAPPARPSSTGTRLKLQAQAQPAKLSPVIIDPVASASLPKVSPEAIGVKDVEGLGADMWKGTSRTVAERLLSMVSPSGSPVLNSLVVRLLRTGAVPPEGDSSSKLMSARIEKLALFGDAASAWQLARQTEGADGKTFLVAAEKAYLSGDESVCGQVSEYQKNHPGVNWQNFAIVCRLRTKDQKAAQVALDILRSEENHDSVFVHIADRNILGGAKTLPSPLSPVSLESLGLLQLANLPLPDAVFGRNEAGARALLRVPAQKDATRLALAEGAAERGLLTAVELAEAYKATSFPPGALASALTSNESGARLRALLFKAAEEQADPAIRIALAVKFVQASPPSFLNGAGGVAALMLGDMDLSALGGKNAAALTRMYMLADSPVASDWFEMAKSSGASDADMQALWPQFALAGFESEGDYASGFAKWFAAAVRNADEATLRDVIAPTLLVLDAAGLKVPDTAWDKVLTGTPNEKRISIAPVIFERMLAAAAANKRAETVLMAAIVAGNGEPSLTKSLGIISSLREAGFDKEASSFARQTVASLAREK